MSGIATAIVGGAVVGGVASNIATKKAADKAAKATTTAAETAADVEKETTQLVIDENKRQFDKIQELLGPYVSAGNEGLIGQLNLLGLNGQDNQAAAIDAIKNGAKFTALRKTGEEAILANAAATGGLRGGNVQGALAKFDTNLLNQLIEEQYANLGGITSLGQNSAVGVGNAGNASTAAISNALYRGGDAAANSILTGGNAASQAILAGGRADVQLYGDIAGSIGQIAGMSKGQFGKF